MHALSRIRYLVAYQVLTRVSYVCKIYFVLHVHRDFHISPLYLPGKVHLNLNGHGESVLHHWKSVCCKKKVKRSVTKLDGNDLPRRTWLTCSPVTILTGGRDLADTGNNRALACTETGTGSGPRESVSPIDFTRARTLGVHCWPLRVLTMDLSIFEQLRCPLSNNTSAEDPLSLFDYTSSVLRMTESRDVIKGNGTKRR